VDIVTAGFELSNTRTDQPRTKESSLSCNLCNIPSFETRDSNEGLVIDSFPGQYGHFLELCFLTGLGEMIDERSRT